MKSIRILKNLFLAILVTLTATRLLGYKFTYSTQITVGILIVAAIVFFMDAFYSRRK